MRCAVLCEELNQRALRFSASVAEIATEAEKRPRTQRAGSLAFNIQNFHYSELDCPHAPALEIFDGLVNLFLRVHHKRTIARHRLIQRNSGDEQHV